MANKPQQVIYNTLSHQKEVFEPVVPGEVRMYVCGPTTYNYIHIGNARPIVVFDTIRRFFQYEGYQVTYVSNFTDVDDKIINQAKKEGKTAKEVAEFYIDAFFEDVQALHVRPADAHPRVSDYMDQIVAFIDGLVQKGHAYVADNGDVYFSVRSFPDYGMLSGRNIDELQAGARVAVGEEKQDPLDFALWKAAKEGEPAWESPWGPGRPGWHIECSAMSKEFLGETFDIHGGGQDLIFPHHENEIAQSCALHDCSQHGTTMANYWVHNGFITINQEKMSKSLGNFFLLREVLAKYDPNVVRFYLLSVHYRSPLDFDDEKLDVATKSLQRLQNAYRALKEAIAKAQAGDPKDLASQTQAAESRFQEAMRDDFNTALGISALFDFAKETNSYLQGGQLDQAAMQAAVDLYDRLAGVLGIDLEVQAPGDDLTAALMAIFIDLRAQARQDKDFALADAIRDRLGEVGVVLEDGKDGTSWKIQK